MGYGRDYRIHSILKASIVPLKGPRLLLESLFSSDFLSPSWQNLVGLFALGLLTASFQFKSRVTVFLLLAAGTALMTIHYAGKDAWSAVAVTGTMIFAHICGAFAGLYPKLKHARGLLLPIIWALTVPLINGWGDILPPLAVTVEILCLTQRNALIARSGFLVSQPMFAVYNVLVQSGPGLLANGLILTSTIIGLFRFYRGALPGQPNRDEPHPGPEAIARAPETDYKQSKSD